MYIDENISLILSHNSTVRFANNKATLGATVYSVFDSIKILQHSIVVINGKLAKWCKDVFLDAQHTVSKSSGSKGVANTDALTRRDSFHIFEHV